MVAKFEKVVLRKVDIQSWRSPAATRAGDDYGVTSIPHTAVFDPQGDYVDTVRGAKPADIEALIRKAGGQ